jgi:hypothetical protein
LCTARRGGQLGAVSYSELRERVGYVVLDCLPRQVQVLGDRWVAGSFDDEELKRFFQRADS